MMPPTMTTARVVTTIYVFAPFARVYIVIRTSEATFTPCIVVTTLAVVMLGANKSRRHASRYPGKAH